MERQDQTEVSDTFGSNLEMTTGPIKIRATIR